MAGFLLLDARLAAIVRHAREPMLGQLRLTWWREPISGDTPSIDGADPLLALLSDFASDRQALAELAAGWELMLGERPLSTQFFGDLALARGRALAECLSQEEPATADARRQAENWALADIATHLGDQDEREAAVDLARSKDWAASPLPRAYRPIAILHCVSRRMIHRAPVSMRFTPGAFLAAVRIGLAGR